MQEPVETNLAAPKTTTQSIPAAESLDHWPLALDKPNSAGPAHVRWSLIASLVIVAISCIIFVFGDIQLAEFPQFTTFHASFVFIGDAIVGFLLLGQFFYSRLPSYLILSGAYLFCSLTTITFLLTFPGAMLAKGGIVGGTQSAIWVWHFWHTLFPVIILLALLVQTRFTEYRVTRAWITPAITGMLVAVVLLAAAVTVAVTVYHDSLPVLITRQQNPLTGAFYIAGGTAAVVTLIALLFSLRLGRRRVILYLWLTVVLAAYLADIIASLGAHDRFTVGWYGGRIEAMIAATVLLPVFVGEITLLYRQIATIMEKLVSANSDLQILVWEKEQVMAKLEKREAEIRQMAYHDHLTTLPNRRLLMDRLQQALAQAKRFKRPLAVMFLDLDRLKEINDSFGHDVGDEALRKIADKFKRCIREGDTISRIGGDEFIIVMPELRYPQDAALVAERILAALSDPTHCLGHDLLISTSIGIAVCSPDCRCDMKTLINDADAAMYHAKLKGRNQYQFSQPLKG